MNKDSWIALIIASIITIVAATPIFYSRDYANGPNSKMTEGSDTKTDSMKGAVAGAESPTEHGGGKNPPPPKGVEAGTELIGGNEEPNPQAGGFEGGGG